MYWVGILVGRRTLLGTEAKPLILEPYLLNNLPNLLWFVLTDVSKFLAKAKRIFLPGFNRIPQPKFPDLLTQFIGPSLDSEIFARANMKTTLFSKSILIIFAKKNYFMLSTGLTVKVSTKWTLKITCAHKYSLFIIFCPLTTFFIKT